jgi:hypothetical protein
MPVPNQPACAADAQIVRYLLGLLPDADADRFDEASIADDEFAARLRSVEADLVDGYVRGTLDLTTLTRFESFYLSSPLRRKNVEFAVRFVRAVDRAAAAATEAVHKPAVVFSRTGQDDGVRQTAQPAGTGRRLKRAWQFMVAAGLLLVASAIFLLRPAQQGSIAGVTASNSVARRLVASGPEETAPDRVGAGREVTPSLHNALTALVLPPQTRAAGSIPVLDIPPRAADVRIELRLESNDFRRYDAALVDPASNQVIWRSEPTSVVSTADGPAVSLVIPARILNPQHYSLKVTGRDADGAEVVGSYAFRVARR